MLVVVLGLQAVRVLVQLNARQLPDVVSSKSVGVQQALAVPIVTQEAVAHRQDVLGVAHQAVRVPTPQLALILQIKLLAKHRELVRGVAELALVLPPHALTTAIKIPAKHKPDAPGNKNRHTYQLTKSRL